MTQRRRTNLAASVRQRLLNMARTEKRAFQELATLFAMERFLFRLSKSEHAETFILKGGLMTLTWAGEHARVTRDIDLLGRGTNSVEAVVARMRDVMNVDVEDGIRFDISSLKGTEITAETAYVGVRATLAADLAGMIIRLQVDVGFGDAVVPDPQWLDYPQILDLGTPRLLGYPAEATLAEKLHAIVVRGLTNSRVKDYYDLWTAHKLNIISTDGLGEALKHTFTRRGTPLPSELPDGLSALFADDPGKQAQWAGFVRKSGLEAPSLEEVVQAAAGLAWPAFIAAARKQ